MSKNVLANKKFSSQRGVIPLFLLLLIVLVIVGGGGFALLQLADPACRDDLRMCLFRGTLKVYEKEADKYNRGQNSPPVITNSTADSAEASKFTGSTQLTVDLAKFVTKHGSILDISFDQKTINGKIDLENQGVVVSLGTNGTVDPESGAIVASVAGQSTKDFSSDKFSGSATTEYSGQFTGTINQLGQASGNLVLTQKIVSVSGNIPGLTTGQTDTTTISWTGSL